MSTSRARKKQRQRRRGADAGAPAQTRAGGGAGGSEPASRTSGPPAPRPPAARRPSRFEVRDGVARPQPIWAPFPLTEIGMAVGLAIFVAGALADGQRSMFLLAVAVCVLTVVVVELCLREHLAGFRSHTLLLAVLPVAILNGVTVVLAGDGWTGPPVLAADLALAGALAWGLQKRFRAARERTQQASEV